MVTVVIEVTGERLVFRHLNTVTQLMGKLKLKQGEVLVIQGGELLTPDRKIAHGSEVRVRHVVSRG
jgi:sulfur carrier protein ThiS